MQWQRYNNLGDNDFGGKRFISIVFCIIICMPIS